MQLLNGTQNAPKRGILRGKYRQPFLPRPRPRWEGGTILSPRHTLLLMRLFISDNFYTGRQVSFKYDWIWQASTHNVI